MSSSTRSTFATDRADVGRPLPALRSVAEPLESTIRQMFLTVINFQFLNGYAATILFTPHPCSRNVCDLILSAIGGGASTPASPLA